MIAKLERTLITKHNPHKQCINNKRVTALSWTADEGTERERERKGERRRERVVGVNAFYWPQIIAMYSTVVKTQKVFSSHNYTM